MKFLILLHCFLSIFGSIFFISSVLTFLTPFSDTEPNKAPTSTIEPSLEFIFDNVPVTGDGTSKFTLSVSSSTIGSSASTYHLHFLTI